VRALQRTASFLLHSDLACASAHRLRCRA
jgi:hypothetical protein